MHRRAWDPERRFVVTVGSRWRRDEDSDRRLWHVVELWKFEQGSGRQLLAVTIERGSDIRRMSQARLIGTMREVSP